MGSTKICRLGRSRTSVGDSSEAATEGRRGAAMTIIGHVAVAVAADRGTEALAAAEEDMDRDSRHKHHITTLKMTRRASSEHIATTADAATIEARFADVDVVVAHNAVIAVEAHRDTITTAPITSGTMTLHHHRTISTRLATAASIHTHKVRQHRRKEIGMDHQSHSRACTSPCR